MYYTTKKIIHVLLQTNHDRYFLLLQNTVLEIVVNNHSTLEHSILNFKTFRFSSCHIYIWKPWKFIFQMRCDSSSTKYDRLENLKVFWTVKENNAPWFIWNLYFGTKDFETCIILPKKLFTACYYKQMPRPLFSFTSKYCARDSC